MPQLYIVYWVKGKRERAVAIGPEDGEYTIEWAGFKIPVRLWDGLALLPLKECLGDLETASIPGEAGQTMIVGRANLNMRYVIFDSVVLELAILRVQGDEGHWVTLEWREPKDNATVSLVAAANASA